MQRDAPVPLLWLHVARADFDIASELNVNEPFALGLRCHHAQQTAEKALKALLLHLGIEPPRTHVIVDLLVLLRDAVAVPPQVESARQLTVYATSTRYPDELVEATPEDQRTAAEMARATLEWASSIIEAGPPAY